MPNAPLPATVRCLVCGYDLRGSDSPRCPECGAARLAILDLETIAIHDQAQYHRAKAALQRERLLAKFMDPGGTFGPLQVVEFGSQIPGWLSVDRTHLDRVEEILDELGILHSIKARPIVDRAEPICPHCDGTLDPKAAEQCPHCESPFTWVEIEGGEPDDSDTLR